MAIATQSPNPNPSLPPLPPQSNPTIDLPVPTPAASVETVSDYEKTREQRIKENRERLEKLGIVDLSNQLKSVSANNTPRRTPKFERRTPLKSPSLGPSEPRRRSSRLQDAPPVMYTEPKEPKVRRTRDVVLEVGSRPEYYTEEHDKLLGSTEMAWTFGEDGYANGSRVYDPVTGKTCHQCRQKTLGQRTRCSNCTLVQGQFCGDCLYARYGEHVVEANQNPNWICPPCRGICNCSLCRQAKGWCPTGAVYRKITNLGYRSVAHYLIQTKREPPAEETVSETQQSAKRALPFEGMDGPTDGSDEKAPENTEHEPTPENSDASEESLMNADVAPNKRGRGRARKSSKTGNADVAEQELKPENADVGEESMMKADVADQKRVEVSGRGRGRPGKRAETETVVGVEGTLAPENADVADQKRLEVRGRGRAGKRGKTETAATSESTLASENDGAGEVAEDEPNPENAVVGEESMMKADVADKKPLEVSGKGRGRPRKRAKTETAAAAEGAITPENTSAGDVVKHEPNPENADGGKDAGAPDKQSPEVIKRGRPRTRSMVGKTDVAEGDVAEHEPVPENVNSAVSKRGRGRASKKSMTGTGAAMVEDAAIISVY